MVIKQRKQIRLKKYDYSDTGWYFVIICTKDRQEYFGNIVDNEMVLSKYGEIINKYWSEIPKHFKNVELDKFQIMPNHIHGIIVIRNINFVGNDPRVVPNNDKHVDLNLNESVGHDGPTLPNTRQQQCLFRIVQWFKTITTNIYIKGVKNNQFLRFDKRIWQKSFYDHVIRNEFDLYRIRQYIKNNPRNWEEDKNNLF